MLTWLHVITAQIEDPQCRTQTRRQNTAWKKKNYNYVLAGGGLEWHSVVSWQPLFSQHPGGQILYERDIFYWCFYSSPGRRWGITINNSMHPYLHSIVSQHFIIFFFIYNLIFVLLPFLSHLFPLLLGPLFFGVRWDDCLGKLKHEYTGQRVTMNCNKCAAKAWLRHCIIIMLISYLVPGVCWWALIPKL